jgi:uncharacterized coiled-coil protein SlyX
MEVALMVVGVTIGFVVLALGLSYTIIRSNTMIAIEQMKLSQTVDLEMRIADLNDAVASISKTVEKQDKTIASVQDGYDRMTTLFNSSNLKRSLTPSK